MSDQVYVSRRASGICIARVRGKARSRRCDSEHGRPGIPHEEDQGRLGLQEIFLGVNTNRSPCRCSFQLVASPSNTSLSATGLIFLRFSRRKCCSERFLHVPLRAGSCSSLASGALLAHTPLLESCCFSGISGSRMPLFRTARRRDVPFSAASARPSLVTTDTPPST